MATFRLTESPPESTAASSEDVKKVAVSSEIQPSDPKNDSSQGIKEIVLKGPLGHAYTEALQLLLNKDTNTTGELRQESTQQAMQAISILEEEEDVPSIPEDARGFVYVYDGKTMGLNDLNNMFDNLSGVKQAHPKAGYMNGTIEHADTLLQDPAKARALETLTTSLESVGVSIYYSRAASCRSILGFMRQKK